MYAVEVTAAISAGGTQQKFYLASAPLTSGPSDTPAHQAFDVALIEPGSLGISAFSAGRTTGAASMELGEVRIANIDGQFDAWRGYSFDGRPIVIRVGEAGDAYPAMWTTLLSATVESVEMTFREVILRIREKSFSLDRPACPNLYAGTNALPNGIEGTAADLKGMRKPRIYGVVRSVEPDLVNTSKLIYRVNDGALASVQAVYDRGSTLTFGTNRADSAAMQATAPAAGSYDTCLSEGLIRLGATPTGRVTVDATEGATTADRTAGQIIYRIALASGLDSSSINVGSMNLVDLDTASAVQGVALRDETFAEALSKIAGGVGAYWTFNAVGVLHAGVLAAPTGTAVVELNESNVLKGIERRSPEDVTIPVWRVVVAHSKLGVEQKNDLAGGVTAAERARLSAMWRYTYAEDASIKDQFLLAKELEVFSTYTDEASAAALASRLLAMHKTLRDLFEVPVPLSLVRENDLWLLSVVSLRLNRFGLSAGKLFRVIGFRLELGAQRAILTLWG